MASVTLKNIKKVYDKTVEAIPNLNLTIHDKEFMVLVGPSGCGKSTLLRMIAGLEDITEGELLIGEKQMNDVEPGDRDIAMVFQSYALFPHMTAYENMAFGLQNRKVPKEEIRQKIMEVAKILDMENLLQRKPKAMSGGQRQRVALGRAMVREPAVFLLDEPLSNLDAKLRTSMRAEIVKLHQKLQTTFIYVTHDQIEAMTMGDRMVVMKDGVIQQVGTPKEIYYEPANQFVAGFIGTPQMNFMEGTMQQTGQELHFVPNGNEGEPITVSKDCLQQKENLNGKAVVLGIRPEHIQLSFTGTLQGSVEFVENLGAKSNVYFKYKHFHLAADTALNIEAARGDAIQFELAQEHLYLFDADTKVRL